MDIRIDETRTAAAEAVSGDLDTCGGRLARRVLRITGRMALGLLAYLVLGNSLILAATGLARWHAGDAPPAPLSSIDNFRVVDDEVWRGAAPGEDGLRDLAALGVTTIVDLRAEYEPGSDDVLVQQLGLEKFHLPVRDGQLPTAAQMVAFDRIVEQADGVVFVHCGAGVGRTGAVVAHHLVVTGGSDAGDALWQNLAIGPPSLEQIIYAARADRADDDRPGLVGTAMSRVLDAPRRIWHNLV